MATVTGRDVVFVVSRSFRREGGYKKRHKCVAGREKPASEQRGAAQCLQCMEWFKSRGGLALYTELASNLQHTKSVQFAYYASCVSWIMEFLLNFHISHQ